MNVDFVVVGWPLAFSIEKTVLQNQSRHQPFSAWCPLKGHTYFNKPAAFFV